MRKKPKQERSSALVETMVEATARVITNEGVGWITTNRVAEVAGVSVGSLYQYFPDKAVLIEELKRQSDETFEERFLRLLARLPQLPVRDAITEWVDLIVEIHAENPTLHNDIGAETPDDAREPMLKIVAGYLEKHADEIRRPDPVLAAQVLLQTGEALIHGTALHAPERLYDADFIAEVRDVLLRYILADA